MSNIRMNLGKDLQFLVIPANRVSSEQRRLGHFLSFMKKTLLCLSILFLAFTERADAQCGVPLVFKNPTLVSGTANTAGARYRFDNFNPAVVGSYAELTIVSIPSGFTVVSVDSFSTTSGGYDEAWQPAINSTNSAGGHVEWSWSFRTTPTVTLSTCFTISTIDNDGYNAAVEEYAGTTNVAVNKWGSQMDSIITTGSPVWKYGRSKAAVLPYELPGIDSSNEAYTFETIFGNRNGFLWRTGLTGANPSGNCCRIFSMFFEPLLSFRPGVITPPATALQCGVTSYDPPVILSTSPASGVTSGTRAYTWAFSTTASTFTEANESQWTILSPIVNSQTYNPPPITRTTYYVRLARLTGSTEWRPSNVVAFHLRTNVTASIGAGPYCVGQNYQLTANSTTPLVNYAWTGPNGFASPLITPMLNSVTAANSGTYTVTASVAGGCSATATVAATFVPCGEVCNNFIDDDGDGFIDEADPDSPCFDPGKTLACDDKLYMVRSASVSTNTLIERLDILAGVPTLTTLFNKPLALNALGQFNGFLYAMANNGTNLYRIDAYGNVVDLGVVAGLPIPDAQWSAGTIGRDGTFYIMEGREGANHRLYRIPLLPGGVGNYAATQILGPAGGEINLPNNPTDIAMDETGTLYAFSQGGTGANINDPAFPGGLFTINLTTGVATRVSATNTYFGASLGSLFITDEGKIYGYGIISSTSGYPQTNFYEINKATGQVLQVGTGSTAVGRSDGASCPWRVTLKRYPSTTCFFPGVTFNWEYAVRNQSGQAFTGVELRDTLDARFSYTFDVAAMTTTLRAIYGNSLTIQLGDLNGGTNNVLTILNMVIPNQISTSLSLQTTISSTATFTPPSEVIFQQAWLKNVATTRGGNEPSDNPLTIGPFSDRTPVTVYITSSPVITTSASSVCLNNTVSVTANNIPGVTYNWNYGSGATPATGTGIGPNNVSYSTLGTKTISLTVTSTTGCSSAPATTTVTVISGPSLTLGATPSVCQGTTIANLPFSASLGSPNRYSINFDLTAEGQGFTDVTNAVLGSGSIAITVPAGASGGVSPTFSATYNATLTVSNTSSGCVGSPQPIQVIVLGAPNITLSSIPSVCRGITSTTLPYSALTVGATQYSIDFNAAAETAGFVDVVNATISASPITIAVPATGPAGTYNATLVVRNPTTGCVSTVKNISVQIIQAVVANAGADVTNCNGNTLNLGANPPAPGNGAWSIIAPANGATLSSNSNPTATVNGLQAGRFVDLVWTITTGTCISRDTVRVSNYLANAPACNCNSIYSISGADANNYAGNQIRVLNTTNGTYSAQVGGTFPVTNVFAFGLDTIYKRFYYADVATGLIRYMDSYGVDVSTGVTLPAAPSYNRAGYNPVDNKMYFISNNAASWASYAPTASGTGGTTTVMTTINYLPSTAPTLGSTAGGGDLVFDAEGSGYIITNDGHFYKAVFSGTTANVIYLGRLTLPNQLLASLAFGSDGKLYLGGAGAFNAATGGFDGSNVYSIDLQTLAVTQLNTALTSATVDFASCSFPFYNSIITPTKTYVKYGSVGSNIANGDTLEYSVKVKNTGNISAGFVRMFDAIPAGTSYVPNSTFVNGGSVTDTLGGFRFAIPGGYLINGTNQAWRSGAINAGDSATITFRVRVNISCGQVDNTATIFNGLLNLITYTNTLSVSTTDPSVADAGANQLKCNNGSFTMAATKFPSSTSGTWTIVGPANGAVINTPTSATTLVTGLNLGSSVTLRWTVSGVCSSSSDDVVLTNSITPTVTLGTIPSVCLGATSVNVPYSATTGSPNQYSIVFDAAAQANGFVNITNAALPSSPMAIAIPAGATAATYNATLTVINATTGCSSNQSFSFTINPRPTANAGSSVTICNGIGTTIGTTALANHFYAWSPAMGLSASNVAQPTANPPLTQIYTVTVTNSAGCTATSSVTVTLVPNTTANAGANQTLCNTNFNITGNTPTAIQTGEWTVVSGSATIASPTTPSTSVTLIAGTTATLRWTVSNASCSSSDDVVLTSTLANAGEDQRLCAPPSFIMTANAPLAGTGTWTLISGVATIASPNSPTTAVTIPVGTIAVLRWTINAPGCVSFDEVVLTNFQAFNADAGPDQAQCNNGNATFTASGGSQSACAASAAIVNGSFEAPFQAPNTWSLFNENSVPGWKTTATDNLIEYWGAPFLGVPAYEGNQLAELNANLASGLYQDLCVLPGDSINWTIAHRGRAGVDVMDIKIGMPGALVTQRTVSTDNTGWVVYTGGYRVPAGQTVTRFQFEAVSTAAGSISVGNLIDDVKIDLVSRSPIPGTWSIVSGTGVITSPNNPTTTVTGVPAGTSVTLRWTSNNGVCSSFDDVVYTNNGLPSITLGANPSVCTGVTSANLPYSSPTFSPNQYSINFDLAAEEKGFVDVVNATLGSSPIVITIPSGANAGTYNATITVRNTVTGCVGAPQNIQVIILPRPTANAGSAVTICNGNSTLIGTAAVAGNTYLWSPATGLSSTSVAQPTANPTTTTTYTVTVTNASGCTATSSVVVTVNSSAATVTDPADQIRCRGSNTAAVNFTGSAIAGTTYSWTNNNTSIGLAASGTGNIPAFTTVNNGGTDVVATITVTPSANGCAGTPQTFTITVRPTATVTPPLNQVLCNGFSTNAVNFTSNIPGTTFTWTNNNTSIGLAASGSGNTIPSFVATNTSGSSVTSTITVTPSSSNGCAVTPQTFFITVNPAPTPLPIGGTNSLLFNFGSTTCSNFNAPSISIIGNPYSTTPPLLANCNLRPPFTNIFSKFISYNPKDNKIYVADIAQAPNTRVWVLDVGIQSNITCPPIPTTPTYVYNNFQPNNFEFDANGDLWSLTGYNTTTGQATIRRFDEVTAATLSTSVIQFPLGANAMAGSNISSGDIAITPNGRMFATFGDNPSKLYEITNYNTPNGTATYLANLPSNTYGIAYLNGSLEITGTNFGTDCYYYRYDIATNTLNTTKRTFQNSQSPIDNTSITPAIGVTKQLVNSTMINSNTADLTYEVYVKNTGNVLLNNINVNDDLAAVYGAANISNVTTSFFPGGNPASLTLNPSYNGITNTSLFNANQTLLNPSNVSANFFARVQISLRVTNLNPATTYLNSAIGTGNVGTFNASCGVGATMVADTSNNGPITVIDPNNNGNSSDVGENIPTPFRPMIISVAKTDVNCDYQSTGTGTVTVNGGTAPFAYAWSSTPAQTTSTASNLPIGTYTVTVTDALGVNATAQIVINAINVTPVVAINSTASTICNGSPTTLTATGGGTYAWSNSATTAATTVTPSVSTTYTVTVTNAGNCSATASQVVTVDQNVTANANADQTQCDNGSFTLAGNTPSVGNGLWTIVGAANGTTITTPTSATTDVTGLTAGNSVTLRWTVSNGTCSASDEVVLTNNANVTANANIDQSKCNNGSFTLAGNVPSVGSGLWTIVGAANGATITIPSSATSGVTGLTVGNSVTLRWTVTNGTCSTSDEVILTNNTLPIASISGTTTICRGSSTTLTATGGGTYLWSTGATTADITVSPTANITYSVTVTNGNGCTAVATQAVTVNQPTTVNAYPNRLLCAGDVLPAINFTGTGTSYTWTNSNTAIGLAASGTGNIASFTVANTGTTDLVSTVTVTPLANGCNGTPMTFTITVKPLPTVPVIANQIKCAGESSDAITLNTSGVTYNWTNNNTAIGLAASGSGTIAGFTTVNTGTTPITAIISITPISNGCTGAPIQVTITVNPRPTASVTGTAVICAGGSTTLTASGSGTYEWSTGATTSSINVSPTANTTYTVTVTNASGCTATASRGVAVNPVPSASISGISVLCSGSSGNITAAGGGTYLWNTGATTATINVSPTVDATYTVTVTNANGCTSTASRVITVNPVPTAGITGISTICRGNNTQLTATGTGTYLWSTNEITANITVTPSATTTYTVTVTNSSNCSATASQVVTVNPLPTASISGTSVICNGSNTTLTAAGGGTYEWSNGATTAAITVNPTADAIYTVTVTNGNGCTATAARTVTVNANVTANANIDQSQCNNGSFTLAANTPSVGSGTWSIVGAANGATITTPSSPTSGVTGLTANSSVTLRWTVVNGTCSSTDDVLLRNNASVTANAGLDQLKCNTGSFTLAGNVPVSPATGLWTIVGAANGTTISTPTSATTNISGLTVGNSVTLLWTVSNGTCVETDEVIMTNNSTVTATAGPTQAKCSNGSFTMAANTVTLPVTGVWSVVSPLGFSTANISDVNSNTATVSNVVVGTPVTLRWTVTNGACSSSSTVVLTNNAAPSVSAAPNAANYCSGTTITLNGTLISGNNTNATWSWAKPDGGAPLTGQNPTRTSSTTAMAGVYTVTFTQSNGCSATATTTVSVTQQPAVTSAGSNQTLCNTNTFTLNATAPTVGTGQWIWVNQGGAAISDINNRNAVVTGIAPGGSAELIWRVTNGACFANSTPIILRNLPRPTATIIAPVTAACTGTSLSFSASVAPSVTYAWTFGSGASVATATGANPAAVSFSSCASRNVRLIAALNGCNDTAFVNINTNDITNPVFGNVPANRTVECDAIPAPATNVTLADNCGIVRRDSFETTTYACDTATYFNGLNAPAVTSYWNAEGRIGGVTTYEMDYHRPSPFAVIGPTADATWHNGIFKRFVYIYNPNAVGANKVTYVLDNDTTNIVLKMNPSSPPTGTAFPLDFDALRVTLTSNSAANTLSMDSVYLNGLPLTLPQNAVSGASRNVLVTGWKLNQGFVITGRVAMSWTGATPTQSALNYGISVGKLATPCVADDCKQQDYLISRTWVAEDGCRNTISATQVIKVQDTKAPVLTIPANITLECGAIPLIPTVTAVDNCDPTPTISFDGEVTTQTTNGNCTDRNYTLTRTWTAIDNCGNDTTLSQIITIVAAPLVDISASSEAICENGLVSLSSTLDCRTGTAQTYQWQQSDDATNWVNVASNGTLPNYSTSSLTQTTHFRLLVTQGACTGYSDTISIIVSPTPSVSVTVDNAIICEGGSVNLTAAVVGGVGTIAYQWQESSNGSTGWADINAATNATYSTPALTVTRYYRVVITQTGAGCATTSTATTVTVVSDPSVTTQPQGFTECTGGTLQLNVTATGGTPLLTYQWQQSPDGLSGWADIASATGTSYTPNSITTGTYYYRVLVRAAGVDCATAISNFATVIIAPDPEVQITVPTTTVCTDGRVILTANPTGGTGTCTVQWQSKLDTSSTWNDVPGATGNTYQTNALNATSNYRAVMSCSGNGCCN
jgi:uncharacterized repeat protein (TIGR01451 family)